MFHDTAARAAPLDRRLRRLTRGEREEEAEDFLRRFHRETGEDDRALRDRLREVRRDLRRAGTYAHTPEELAFGARVAWRNHARCVGRLYWRSLDVIDAREVREPDEIAARTFAQLDAAFAGGRIRNLITIFAPVAPGAHPAYIESPQVTQYAGYRAAEGTRLGDTRNEEATRSAIRLGWRPPDPPGDFDLLPLVVRDASGRRRLYETPRRVVREVTLRHPRHPAFDRLGLRWYATPCVSDMILTIGGVDYPCAPFTGWYVCTEIASRDLADEHRYDRLADVARAIGEDPEGDDPFWKDRALTELNLAVVHSFRRDGVTIADHHQISGEYMSFERRERAEGRRPSGDWTWITPPQASAACPVFHSDMSDLRATPNFYRSRVIDGAGLGPDRSDERWGRARRRYEREKRRWRALRRRWSRD